MPPESPRTVDYYEDDRGHSPIETWMDKLSDPKAAALISAIEHVLAVDGIKLARGPWLKPLGGGLWEFRVRYSASEIEQMFSAAHRTLKEPEKILLRVFVTFHGDRIVLLFDGYDKGADDSPRRQQREITEARKMLAAWERRGRP